MSEIEDKQDKQEKIKALRGNLKDGRANQSGQNIGPDHRDDDHKAGTDFQIAGRAISNLATTSGRLAADTRKSGSDRRGTKAEPLGQRSADRRSGEDNGGFADDSTGQPAADGARAVGRFLAEEPVPTRKIEVESPNPSFKNDIQLNDAQQKLSTKYPNLNAILSDNPTITVEALAAQLHVSGGTAHAVKKEWLASAARKPEEAPAFKMPSLPKGRTLSKTEAKELADSFISSLESDFQALDEYLWARQLAAGIDTNEQPIWSDLDTEQIEKLTRIMLRWGQNNAAAATVVRATVESADYIAVGSMFVPRIQQTVKVMRGTRRKPIRRGQQHEN